MRMSPPPKAHRYWPRSSEVRRPTFIARQAAKPSGLLGRIIAAIMVRESEADNRAAIEALSVQPGDRILDVGCGAGKSLELLLPLVGDGAVAGIDPSPLMVKEAKRRNFRGKAQKHLSIQVAAVEAMPFEDQTFDAAMSVHTIYFWQQLGPAMHELARVLRPGGWLVLLFRTSASQAAANFPESVYQFRTFKEVTDQLISAGFDVRSQMVADPQEARVILIAQRSDRGIRQN